MSTENQKTRSAVKPFQCDICNRHYSTQAALKVHRAYHTSGKTELCDCCGASFNTRGQLKIHMRIHTGEKPYKCDKCDKAFSYRESLITHSTLHTRVKPFACGSCNARFSCIGNLLKHRKARCRDCGLIDNTSIKPIVPRPNKKTMPNLTDRNIIDFQTTENPKFKQKYSSHSDAESNVILNVEQDELETDVSITNRASNYGDFIVESLSITAVSGGAEDKGVVNDDDVDENDKKYPLATVLNLTENQLNETNENKGDETVEEFCININNQDEGKSYMYIYTFLNDEASSSDSTLSTRQGTKLWAEVGSSENQGSYQLPKNISRSLRIISSPLESVKEKGCAVEDDKSNEKLKNTKSNNSIKGVDISKREEKRNNVEHEAIHSDDSSLDGAMVEEDEVDRTCDMDSKSPPPEESNETHLSDSPNDDSSTDAPWDEPDEESLKRDEEILQKQLVILRDSSEPLGTGYQCRICPQQYTTEYLMARHLGRVHNLVLDKARDKLKYSKNITKNLAKYRCKYCDQSYVNAKRLAKHVRKHGAKGRLRHKCPCCNQYFETKDAANQHAQEQHRDRLECDLCQKRFRKPENLQRHFRYAHGDVKEARRMKHICSKCGKYFPSLIALSDHERAKCGLEPIYACDKCDKCYSSYSSLTMHKSMHENVLPYECSFCKKKFRTKGEVKVHERSHTGEKPFRCEVCSKSFPYRQSLLTHRTTHTGVTRYECTVCFRKFSCITNLKSHKRLHHDETTTIVNQAETNG